MNKNVVLTKILLAILAVGFLCAVEFFILSNRVETSNISLGYTSKILLIEFTALLLGLLFSYDHLRTWRAKGAFKVCWSYLLLAAVLIFLRIPNLFLIATPLGLLARYSLASISIMALVWYFIFHALYKETVRHNKF